MKFNQFIFGLSLLISTQSSVFAYENYYDADEDKCFMDTCASECHQLCKGWYVHTATLWWKATEDGLALGQEVLVRRNDLDSSSGIYDVVKKRSKVKTPDFQYDSGFRLGLIYDSPHTCLTAFFDWTHFDNSASVKGESCLSSTNPPGDTYNAFQPYWESLAQNYPDKAKGKWRLHLDLFDLSVGHAYYICDCRFSLKPFFGLRIASIEQKFHVKSQAQSAGVFNGASYDYVSDMKAHCDFLGVGPRLGCDAQLKLCGGFSIFGQAGGSLVYGEFDCHAKEHFSNRDYYYYKFNHYEDHAYKDNRDFRTRGITDLAIGIRFGNTYEICQRRIPIVIALSWEHHAFWDFNRFNFESDGFTNTDHNSFDFGPYANILSSPNKCGNLFTQGLTAAFNFAF